LETVNDDAFIALSAKKKGFLVKYETESRVSICGPQTLREYFRQRRRILFGHKQVKKITGESPQHLIYLFPSYPIHAIKLLQWAIMKYGYTLFAFLIVEFVINIVAMLDSILGKTHTTWSISTSTKEIP